MKIAFRKIKLSKQNKQRLELINSIIEEYQLQGYRLTLRQLYYQLVSRDVVPNKLAEYAKLSTLLKEGRMGGVVDWDAIEDRLRKPSKPASFDSPEQILQAAISQYMLPRMEGQQTYVEVWVEKDALSGVLSRVTQKYHIPIVVNRGYSSASAMYDAYERFAGALNEGCSKCVVLYLGDFDPSGVDMIRDITERTLEFLSKEFSWPDLLFEVQSIALTKNQILQYNPPPNPAKKTDPRAKSFISSHGNTSWEVDALRPEVLNTILEEAILHFIDIESYENIVAREEGDRKRLQALLNYL